MRIMIKGGVWKNTEDEILKAAVMKYGLNQWARISSLLVRKSAKQCKARWYEWLDPSIKKTEWTREEDEKLLHLAKLMPTQWRTIAPIVGRTPAQCLERYEKLLDMAVSKDERYDPADDPRRLRPGEIDPNPESKPARPDPVDMDEDEKEMLSEARARLANTRGKKAKRKAREKALEEARRLAALQKKRELKAAGIELRGKDRKRRGIDYNKEVALEKKPAIGFYDTTEEDMRSREISQEFRPVTVEELEGKRRKDIEEGLMKGDIKRQKMVEDHNAPGAVAKANELNDPHLMRKRAKLMLPGPQVSEVELEQIARMSTNVAMDPSLIDGAGGDATRQLLGDYTQTPARMAQTPLRTPRTAAGHDRILAEAQALARLQNMNTPLIGGENPDLSTSDFTGMTPRQQVTQTPNPLAAALTPRIGATPGPGATPLPGATPRSIAGIGIGATPGPGLGPGATPMRTPLRDALGLNDMDSLIPADSKKAAAAQQASMRAELRARLASLPDPENEYTFAAPEVPEEKQEEEMEEDAAELKKKKLQQEAEKRAEEERKKSQVLQRQLPRPVSLDQVPTRPADKDLSQLNERELAEAMLNEELIALLKFDAAKYPLKEKEKERKKDKESRKRKEKPQEVPQLESFSEAELEAARKTLVSEQQYVQDAMGHMDTPFDEYMDTWLASRKDIIYIPSHKKYARFAAATNTDRLESARSEFELVRSEMEKEAKRAAKIEEKVKVVLRGLQDRSNKLEAETRELWEKLQDAQMELQCFKALHEQEQRAAPERLEGMKEAVAAQQKREKDLQERYKQLQRQKMDIWEALHPPVVVK